MPQPLYILFGFLFTVLTATALGRLLLARLKLSFHRTEEFLLAFYAGSACLSFLVLLLAAARLAHKGVFLAIGLVVLFSAVRKNLHRAAGEPQPGLPRFWTIVFGVIYGAFLLVYFTNAMAPEQSPDGSTYHLGLVARYMRAHGFERITTNMYASLSQGVEMLFLFAFAFGRHSAAALTHFAFLATLPLAMLCYARRFGFPVAGAAAALLFFASPVVGMDGTTAYIDVAVAAVLFAVFYLLQIWDQSRNGALLVPVGLLAGFAYAAKYTAGIAVPYALGFAAWKLIRARRPLLKPLLVLAGCALLMIVPWMAKNWIWLGNPFSPFLNELFPNPYVHIAMEKEYREFFRHYDLKNRLEIVPEVTVRGFTLNGLLGPVFLLLPLGLLALREKAGRQIWLAALVFSAAYPLNISTRFLIPPAPFFALAIAMAVVRARGMAALLVMMHALASWPSHVKVYSDPAAWKIQKAFPWKQALRVESEEGWLLRSMPTYPAARMIEQYVPPGERTFTYNQVAEAYTTRDILVGYAAAFNQTLFDTLWIPLAEDWSPRRLVIFRFPEERLRAVRVVLETEREKDSWSINEFRLFRQEREIRPDPAWKLASRPNPWELDLAFDGNLATRWRTWQEARAGMFVEVGFNSALALDQVLLQCPMAPWNLQFALEGLTEDGRWKRLGGQPSQPLADEPPGLRRAAIDSLFARGVRWLLIRESDFGGKDLRERASEWGVEFVAERGPDRLYRVTPRTP